MFVLNERKLREAMATQDGLAPFKPSQIIADELHAFVDRLVDSGIIEVQRAGATIGVVPISQEMPVPHLTVCLGDEEVWYLGGEVFLGADDVDLADATVTTIQGMVDDAEQIAETHRCGDRPPPLSDSDALDHLASFLAETEPPTLDELRAELERALARTGRPIA